MKVAPSLVLLTLCLLFLNCKTETDTRQVAREKVEKKVKEDEVNKSDNPLLTLFKQNAEYFSDGYDYPVNPPDAENYYNAQEYGKNKHLGDDWNALTGGDSDLGHPIYAIGNGLVNAARDYGGGWGNVIRVLHCSGPEDGVFTEAIYAHCDTMLVKGGQWVKRGEKIGTIGNVGGLYSAHLHLEIRDNINMGIGQGYSDQTDGYLDPTVFIEANRAEK